MLRARFLALLVGCVALLGTQWASADYVARFTIEDTTGTVLIDGNKHLTVAPNTNVLLTLWVRDASKSPTDGDQFIQGLKMQLSLPAALLPVNANVLTATDGFAENSPLIGGAGTNNLGNVVDGDLLSDLALQYGVNSGQDGIVIPSSGSTSFKVGTLSVHVPATPGVVYTLGWVSGSGNALTTETETPFARALQTATITTTPEPATILLGLGALGTMVGVRRRIRREKKAA